MAATKDEQRRYPLTGKDPEILEKIHEVEKLQDLCDDERFLLLFLRTQLEDDWRKPCLELLDVWIKNREKQPSQRWDELKKAKEGWWNPERT